MKLAAAGALALLRVAAFCGLGVLGIKVIEEKYLIGMVVGVAILFAWSLYLLAGRCLAQGSVLAAIVLFWGCRDFVRDLRVAEDEPFEPVKFAPPASTDAFGPLPIVVDSPRFATMERYAAPAIEERIYYLIDPEVRLKYSGNDALDRSFLLNPGFFGRHVEPVKSFNAAYGEFLLYERLPDTSWILK